MTSSQFDLKTLKISLLRFFKWFVFQNHDYNIIKIYTHVTNPLYFIMFKLYKIMLYLCYICTHLHTSQKIV